MNNIISKNNKVRIPVEAVKGGPARNVLPYLQGASSKTDISLVSSSTYRNLMINGDFQVWQRGTTVTNPTNATYIADRWIIFNTASGMTLPTSIVHSRQSLTPGDIPGASYYYNISTNGAGTSLNTNTLYGILIRLEHTTRLCAGINKFVTVSFYAKSDLASRRIGVELCQRYGTGGSPTSDQNNLPGSNPITLSSTWKRYSVTFELSTLVGKTFGTNFDDNLQLTIYIAWGTTTGANRLNGAASQDFAGTGNICLAGFTFNMGKEALPFEPRPFADELRLCQRYYEKSYDYGTTPGTAAQGGFCYALATANNALDGTTRFAVPKRTSAPTMAIYSYNGTANKVSQVGTAVDTGGTVTIPAAQTGTHGFGRIVDSGTAFTPGIMYWYHFTADAELS